jgi:hypothetical protein
MIVFCEADRVAWFRVWRCFRNDEYAPNLPLTRRSRERPPAAGTGEKMDHIFKEHRSWNMTKIRKNL